MWWPSGPRKQSSKPQVSVFIWLQQLGPHGLQPSKQGKTPKQEAWNLRSWKRGQIKS